jgi:hypothetical protein
MLQEMQRRLARCPVLQQCSELKARKAAVEQELAAGLKGAEKEVSRIRVAGGAAEGTAGCTAESIATGTAAGPLMA